jgi:hypothetical protein
MEYQGFANALRASSRGRKNWDGSRLATLMQMLEQKPSPHPMLVLQYITQAQRASLVFSRRDGVSSASNLFQKYPALTDLQNYCTSKLGEILPKNTLAANLHVGTELELPVRVVLVRDNEVQFVRSGETIARTDAKTLDVPMVALQIDNVREDAYGTLEFVSGPFTVDGADGLRKLGVDAAKAMVAVAYKPPAGALETFSYRGSTYFPLRRFLQDYNQKMLLKDSRFRLAEVAPERGGSWWASAWTHRDIYGQPANNVQVNIEIPLRRVASDEYLNLFDANTRFQRDLMKAAVTRAGDLVKRHLASGSSASTLEKLTAIFALYYFESAFQCVNFRLDRVGRGPTAVSAKNNHGVLLKTPVNDLVREGLSASAKRALAAVVLDAKKGADLKESTADDIRQLVARFPPNMTVPTSSHEDWAFGANYDTVFVPGRTARYENETTLGYGSRVRTGVKTDAYVSARALRVQHYLVAGGGGDAAGAIVEPACVVEIRSSRNPLNSAGYYDDAEMHTRAGQTIMRVTHVDDVNYDSDGV